MKNARAEATHICNDMEKLMDLCRFEEERGAHLLPKIVYKRLASFVHQLDILGEKIEYKKHE